MLLAAPNMTAIQQLLLMYEAEIESMNVDLMPAASRVNICTRESYQLV